MVPILTLVVLCVLMITPVFGNGGNPWSDLVAGQDEENPVGILTITFDDNMMIVTYDTTDTECLIIETHLWVGTDLEGVPRTKSGNPKIGQFPNSTYDEDGTDEVTYEIPVTPGETYFILAHAVVDCPCIGMETAWGEGPYATMFSQNQDVFGTRWGYYLEIDVP